MAIDQHKRRKLEIFVKPISQVYIPSADELSSEQVHLELVLLYSSVMARSKTCCADTYDSIHDIVLMDGENSQL